MTVRYGIGIVCVLDSTSKDIQQERLFPLISRAYRSIAANLLCSPLGCSYLLLPPADLWCPKLGCHYLLISRAHLLAATDLWRPWLARRYLPPPPADLQSPLLGHSYLLLLHFTPTSRVHRLPTSTYLLYRRLPEPTAQPPLNSR